MIIDSIEGNFHLKMEVTKVDQRKLLTLSKPRYKEMISEYHHLRDVKVGGKKQQLPVHLILGSSDYAKIKTETKPRIGCTGKPVAELTRLGWMMMSLGKEIDLSNMLSMQTATGDDKRLCQLDILGLKGYSLEDQKIVYEEFKEQLTKSPEVSYETGLPWKAGHPPLPNNKSGSIKRLENLVRKLKKQGALQQYNQIIQDQRAQGIVEKEEEKMSEENFTFLTRPS